MPSEALLVVDFQNDFCVRPGRTARLTRVAANIERALARARKLGHEVIWIRFLGDRRKANMIERDRRQGKAKKCLAGTWGAGFFKLRPLATEPIIDKPACFDAFLNPGLESRLKKKGVKRLTLAGVYLDVCVDATARTAFQKGYFVRILKDCTDSLHYRKSDVLRFMAKYYGAEVA